MAVYAYKAIDLDRCAVAGTVIADTARQARDQLRARGLTITEVAEFASYAGRSRGLAILRRRTRRAEVVSFIRDLATLLRVGIALLEALRTLARQQPRGLRPVVQQLDDRVAAGLSLGEAMGLQPEVFDTLSVSIVRVGEDTGSLEQSLAQLADFKERTVRLKSRVVTAVLYPAVVFTVGIAIMIFLMTYVVPNILTILDGKELPTVTKLVKTASDLIIGWWWLLAAGVAGAGLAVKGFLSTRVGRRLADRLVLRLPLVGTLVRKENTSRMAVVLAALLRSGLPFVEAVRTTRATLRNGVYRQALAQYEAAVAAGGDVAGPLERTGAFSPMVARMLAVGQQSGELEGMLEQLASTYDREVAQATERLTAVLEPLLIVLLALMVGTIVFATILPIMEINDVL